MSGHRTRSDNALPIDEAIPPLRTALATHSNVVLEAPPGAGKTTRVPLALRNEKWLNGARIVMLEPRRLAARAAANYMARTIGEQVGDTVGYRVRGDSRTSSRTRIEVVTEGVLTRLMARDSTLDGVGLLIFDEFHERSLHADLGLALALQTQELLRPELRVLVMSATLEGAALSALLSDAKHAPAPVVTSVGRQFPVETHYRARRPDERVEATVARAVREVVQKHDGDVLVFLPGAGEQRRVAEKLESITEVSPVPCRVHQLHGSMPLPDQDAAIAPAPRGERKIVLATSIAETSLTIEGVRVVVDAGLSRLPRFSARAGITRLETVRVSRASADQRRGRAGRVAPGLCYRLWDQHEDSALVPRTRPEILEADLAPLALELADAGVSDPAELRWLDTPPVGAFRQSRELLLQLGALDANGTITNHGRAMAELPTHPRLAHLMLVAESRGLAQLGSAIATLVEERDVLRGNMGPPLADIHARLELLQGTSVSALHTDLAGAEVDLPAVRRLREQARELKSRMARGTERRAETAKQNTDAAGVLIAHAYPDRIAQRRSGSEPRFVLRSGTGVVLPKHDALQSSEFLAVATLEGAAPDFRIALAASISREEIVAEFSAYFEREMITEWDDAAAAVRVRQRTRLGAIVLDEHIVSKPDAQTVRDAFIAQIVRVGIAKLPWSDSATQLRQRLAFLHARAYAQDARWPDVSDSALEQQVSDWLAPLLEGVRRWDELARLDFGGALLSLLDWSARGELDKLAPTHVEVPSGSRIAVDYADVENPVLAVKLQEVFGWSSTPLIMNGQVPLTLHLLSPARRPVQVTRDLAGFWRNSYFEVRKEMRGRYPRHPWPDDPLAAEPTRRAKPRGT